MRQIPHLRCFIILLASSTGCMRSEPRVVLYCAQDRRFAALLLEGLQHQTGFPIVPQEIETP